MDDIIHYVHDWNLADSSELLQNVRTGWMTSYTVYMTGIWQTILNYFKMSVQDG